MPDFIAPLPDAEILKKTVWQQFNLKDVIYALVLVFMLMNQHFNEEQRLQRLETTQADITATLLKITTKMDEEMVPRKEIQLYNANLSTRLGNIESSQNNIMTYLLNHGAK